MFLNDKNMFEGHNPIADVVEIQGEVGGLSKGLSSAFLKYLERDQPGAGRMGGSWERMMKDGELDFKLISSGRRSDFTESDYDWAYRLISGNY